MIDTSIYNMLGRGVKSVQDYDNEAMQGQQNKLALMASQGQMQDQQQARKGENALARLLAGGGDVAKGLASEGYGKQAMAYTKQQQDIDKQKSDIAHQGAQSLKLNTEAVNNRIAQWRDLIMTHAGNPLAASALVTAMHSDATLKDTPIAQIPLEQGLSQIGQDPESFGNWKKQFSLGATKFIEQNKPTQTVINSGGSNQVIQTPGLGGTPQTVMSSPITQSANNMADNLRSAQEGNANRGVTLRGQNMTDGRAREATAQGKTPTGYRVTPDGNLAAIPGGPADLKMQGALNQDTASLNGSTSSMDRLGAAANEVLNHPGLKSVYGLRGVVPNIPGSEAADAQALLNTLKSQVGFGVLQDMRNNSKTGGALGAVSDKENAMLQANLAALEKSQSVEQAKASLKKIVDYVDGAKDRLRGAYNIKHGGRAAAAEGSKPASEDAAAIAWANANPNDPRSAKIKQMHGGK